MNEYIVSAVDIFVYSVALSLVVVLIVMWRQNRDARKRYHSTIDMLEHAEKLFNARMDSIRQSERDESEPSAAERVRSVAKVSSGPSVVSKVPSSYVPQMSAQSTRSRHDDSSASSYSSGYAFGSDFSSDSSSHHSSSDCGSSSCGCD